MYISRKKEREREREIDRQSLLRRFSRPARFIASWAAAGAGASRSGGDSGRGGGGEVGSLQACLNLFVGLSPPQKGL